MSRARSISRRLDRSVRNGFTLVELLTAMAVLSLLSLVLMRIVAHATNATQAIEGRITAESAGRAVLDRIGVNLAGMVKTSGSTLLVGKDVGNSAEGPLNDALAFISTARTGARSGLNENDIRFAAIGYKIRSSYDPETKRASPILSWGEGAVVFPSWDSQQIRSDLFKVTSYAAADIASTNDAGDMLRFQPMADGVFRLEICFLLDDGRIVATPPRHRDFSSITPPGIAPIAFDSASSADVDRRYVKALIVGLAVLDGRSRQSLADMVALAQGLPDATDEQTPLQAWNINALADHYSAPVVGSIRFFQRFYYVR